MSLQKNSVDHIKEKMSSFNVQIRGEIIVLKKASAKTQLELAVSRFINL